MSGRLDHTYELIKNDEAEKDQEFQLAISQWRTGFTITSYTRSNRAFEQVIQLSLDEDYASVRRALQNSSYRGDGNIRNLLSYAVQCGSLRRAQILIDNGCDVGQALMLLIRAGDTAGITNLLALKNFNIEAILNKPYLTPEGREEYPLEYLLHCEPTFSELRVDSSTIYDQLKANTRPDKAMYDRLIDAAIEGGNSRVLTSLLKQDPSYCSDDSLLIKLLSGDLKTTAAAFYPIARVLLDARILNAPVHKSVDESGNTPLHYVWGVKNAGDLPYECAYLTDDPKMALFMLLIRRGIDPFQTNVHNNKGFPYDPYDGTKSPAPLQYYNRYKEFVTTCNSGDQQKIDALFARYAHPGDNHQQTLIQFAQDAVNGTLAGVKRNDAFRTMINEKLAVIDPAKKIPNIVPLPIPETQLQEYKITLSTSSKSSQEKAKAIGEAPTEEAALIAAVQQRHPLFRTRATILSGEGKNLVKNNPEFQTIATVTEWVKQYIRYLEGPFKLKKGSDKVTELKAALAAAEQLHKNNPNLTLYAFVTTGQPSLVSEIKKPRWGKHGEARGWTDFCDVFTSIAEQLPNVQNPPPPPPP